MEKGRNNEENKLGDGSNKLKEKRKKKLKEGNMIGGKEYRRESTWSQSNQEGNNDISRAWEGARGKKEGYLQQDGEGLCRRSSG